MNLPILSLAQYQIVYNSLSFVIASFLGALVYFILGRREVSPTYRGAITISSVIMVIAGYHYFRIFNSWEEAYSVVDSMYKPTGKYFDASYRYIDWLLTVPLLSAELIIATSAKTARKKCRFLMPCFAAGLMVVLGLVGDTSTDPTTRTIWAVLSTIPFIYVMYSLCRTISEGLPSLPAEVRNYGSNLRYLLVATWGVYPIVYSFPNWGLTDAKWTVTEQVLFCIADVLAKAYFGLILHWIARARSEQDGFAEAA